MYPIDYDIEESFKADAPQYARLTFGDTVLTQDNITQGGLSINRYCSSSDKIEIGSTISAELTLVLNNIDGDLNDITFIGQSVFVEIGVYDEIMEEITYIPMGYFKVDGSPRKLTKINLSALDCMTNFDKAVDENVITFPYTVSELLQVICQVCDVELGIDPDELLNADYEIPAFPEGYTSYRQILSAICEITATCAFIDWQNKLVLKWFERTGERIELSDRYTSDIFEEPIEITGFQIIDGENVYVSGNIGYVLGIDNNALIQTNHQEICDSIFEVLDEFTYTPFSATVAPMPHIYPLDMVSFIDKDETEIDTIITDWTFKMNGNTALKGRGETSEQVGYGSSYNLTKQEISMVEELAKKAVDQMGFYESRNNGVIRIGNNETRQVAYMKMASKKTTRVQIHIEVNLNAVDTDADEITTALCTYYIDSDEVTAIHPAETYIDGNHVLHLMYILNMGANVINRFRLTMTARGGEIIIPAKGMWLYASGLNIIGDSVWDGDIDLFDDAPYIPIPMFTFASATEDVDIERKTGQEIPVSDNAVYIPISDFVFAGVVDDVVVMRHNTAYERITEDGDSRVTEDGDIRYTEEEY